MSETQLRLPATLRLAQAGALWRDWQAKLRAEALGVGAQAGREVHLSAAALQDFDSASLSLLLGCARLCNEHGMGLRIHDAPDDLRRLARLYGVEELLWPAELVA